MMLMNCPEQTKRVHTNHSKSAWLLLTILFLGLFLRLAAWMLDPIVSRDGASYLIEAQKWSASPGSFHYASPPLLLYILRVYYQLGLNAELWGCILNISMGIIFVFLVFKVAYLLFSCETAGLYAAFLVAVHPYLIQISYQIQREPIYYVLVAIIVWRLVKFGSHDTMEKNAFTKDSVLIGGLLALSVFFRHEGWFGFPFLLIVAIYYGIISQQWKNVLKYAALFLVSFFTVFSLLALMTNLFQNVSLIIEDQYKETFGSF